MKKLILIFLLIPFLSNAQINENFENGLLTNWTQSTPGNWDASNINPLSGLFSLHHAQPLSVSGTDQISIPFGTIDLTQKDVVWRFQVKYNNNPSASNSWNIFLFSDQNSASMLPGSTANGYIIGVNYNTISDDFIKLQKVTAGTAVPVSIISTSTSWAAQTTAVGFEVTRSKTGNWTIYCDLNGGFDNLVMIGTSAINTDFTTANYFGIYHKYTSSLTKLLWIDDVQCNVLLDQTSTITTGPLSEPLSISSLVDTEVEKVSAFDFTLSDLQSGDGVPTLINQLSITQNIGNTITDWTNAIAGAELSGPDLSTPLSGIISSNSISFASTNFISIAENTSETYVLKIWLKSDLSEINDNELLNFKLSNSGIICNHAGSSFAVNSVQSGNEFIDIDATKLKFANVNNSIPINSAFYAKVIATDINNNIDLDFAGSIVLSRSAGTGNLTSVSGLTKQAISGQIDWNDLMYNQNEIFSINANSATLIEANSGNIYANKRYTYLFDDFEDGNTTGWKFSRIDAWEASAVNPLNGLSSLHQKFDNSADGTDQISYKISGLNMSSDTTIWQFQIKHGYSPSSGNLWAAYLCSDKDSEQMTAAGNANGYVLGVNFTGSNDTLTLWKINDKVITQISKTTFNWENSVPISSFASVKVVRSNDGIWSIFVDSNGGFDNLIKVSTDITDIQFTELKNFGFLYKYSGSQDMKLWLDDVSIVGQIDEIAPVISSLNAVSQNILKVQFSEIVSQSSAENLSNYSINSISPTSAILSTDNQNEVILTFLNTFTDGVQYNLITQNISDLQGNILLNSSNTFVYTKIFPSNLVVKSSTEIDVFFTKDVDEISSQLVSNYSLNNGIGNPVSALKDVINPKIVHLIFSTQFQLSQSYVLSIENIEDLYGNIISPKTLDFIYYIVQPYDIAINEIMCDINPIPVAIPPYKYIELYNITNFEFNLSDWTLTIGENSPVVFPDSVFAANSYLIICESAANTAFLSYSKTLPVLNSSQITTTGKKIVLADKTGVIISNVNYSNSWYDDQNKNDGGWSLEKIDPSNNCTENENWTASADYSGGTPGRINSVNAINPDIVNPIVTKLQFISARQIKLEFSENLKQSTALNLDNYIINNSIKPSSIVYDLDSEKILTLNFDQNFEIGSNSIIINQIEDNCDNIIIPFSGNFIYNIINPTEVKVMSANQLVLIFSENVDETSALNLTNYFIDNQIGNPSVVFVDAIDKKIVNLMFASNFPEGQFNNITIKNVFDIFGNICNEKSIRFAFHIPKENDIVFTEIMCDVNPIPVGLPESQYVEIKNISQFDINLKNWIFEAEGSTLRTLPDITLLSSEYATIIPSSNENLFTNYGKIIPLMSSSDLTLSGKKLSLYKSDNSIISQIIYSNNWYNDTNKEDGGWSIEIIDPLNFCGTTTNWKASVDFSGGTPGRVNSVNKLNLDITKPLIDTFTVVSSNSIILSFSKDITKTSAEILTNYFINNQIGNCSIVNFDFLYPNKISLFFGNQFEDKKTNILTVQNVSDKCGNVLDKKDLSFVYNKIKPINLWISNQNQLIIKFSENIDHVSGSNILNYTADNSLNHPENILIDANNPAIIYVKFQQNFAEGTEIKLNLSGIKDVNNNSINDTTLTFTYYIPKSNDLIINEILFNPKSGGADFVEIYNRSTQRIDLINFKLANRDADGNLASEKELFTENFLIKPGEFYAFTISKDLVLRDYTSNNQSHIIQIPAMPSYSDDSGVVVLAMNDSIVIDELSYNSGMHFGLLCDVEGVSLERVNYNRPTYELTNWQSASYNVSFATPAYKNSQYLSDFSQSENENIKIIPELFSPDNDGIDDYANISYKFNEAGYVANISIFDANGLLKRKFVNNQLLSTEGVFTWDGLDDKENKVKCGIYILYFEIFDLTGNVKKFKKALVLASKF